MSDENLPIDRIGSILNPPGSLAGGPPPDSANLHSVAPGRTPETFHNPTSVLDALGGLATPEAVKDSVSEVPSEEPERCVISPEAAKKLNLPGLLAELTTPDAIRQQSEIETNVAGRYGLDSKRGTRAAAHVNQMYAAEKAGGKIFAGSADTPDIGLLVERIQTASLAAGPGATYELFAEAPLTEDAVLVDGDVVIDAGRFTFPVFDEETLAQGMSTLRSIPAGELAIEVATVFVQPDGSVFVVPQGSQGTLAAVANRFGGVTVRRLEVRLQPLAEIQQAAAGPEHAAEDEPPGAREWERQKQRPRAEVEALDAERRNNRSGGGAGRTASSGWWMIVS